MPKSLHAVLYSFFIVLCFNLFFSQKASAQTDADALMIPKNYFCAAGSYAHNSWTNYWEGTFKRDNGNIGTLTTNTYMIGGNYGITNKLDVLFSVPYVTTNASAGTLKGQQGFQDFTLTLKYLAFLTEIGKGIFSIHAIASGSLPMTNYEADFQPVSIGLHSKTAALRALANYQVGRFFIAGAGQYIYRDDITIDRNSYYTTQLIYSNKVYIPNATNFLVSTGFRSLKLNVEAIVAETTDRGGFDIRKNDNPFPGNNVNYTTAGGLVKYSFEGITGLELTLGGNYVVKGRNVGQSTNLYGSVYYVFGLFKKDNK